MQDVVLGKIYFLLVRIKIKHMEVEIRRRETTGAGASLYNESETLAKFEIMDGAPVRGACCSLDALPPAPPLSPLRPVRVCVDVPVGLRMCGAGLCRGIDSHPVVPQRILAVANLQGTPTGPRLVESCSIDLCPSPSCVGSPPFRM